MRRFGCTILLVALFSLASPAEAQWTSTAGIVAFTESRDADHTFSLGATCMGDSLVVELEYLLATPYDDIGIEQSRFDVSATLEVIVDGQESSEGWRYSEYSESFVNRAPSNFLALIERSEGMVARVVDKRGHSVGVYSFSLVGASRALGRLNCYTATGG